jgi:hypothetical protein
MESTTELKSQFVTYEFLNNKSNLYKVKDLVGKDRVHTMSYWYVKNNDDKIITDGLVIYRKPNPTETDKKIVSIMKLKNSDKGVWSNGELIQPEL